MDGRVMEITPGSFWRCGSILFDGLSTSDIFAKVLKCTATTVYIIRKQDYGFTDLSPASYSIDEFLAYYQKLEQ